MSEKRTTIEFEVTKDHIDSLIFALKRARKSDNVKSIKFDVNTGIFPTENITIIINTNVSKQSNRVWKPNARPGSKNTTKRNKGV